MNQSTKQAMDLAEVTGQKLAAHLVRKGGERMTVEEMQANLTMALVSATLGQTQAIEAQTKAIEHQNELLKKGGRR